MSNSRDEGSESACDRGGGWDWEGFDQELAGDGGGGGDSQPETDLKNIFIVFQVWAVSRTLANLESLKVKLHAHCTMAKAWQLCFLIAH